MLCTEDIAVNQTNMVPTFIGFQSDGGNTLNRPIVHDKQTNINK